MAVPIGVGEHDMGRAVLRTLHDFGFVYLRQGSYAQAESYAAQALAGRRHALGAGASGYCGFGG